MSFTKVAPAGIGTEPGDGYRIGNSFLHSTGLNVSGIITATEGGTVSYYGDGSNLTGVNPTVANGCVYENSTIISSDYTMSTNKNGLSAGPITINSGVVVEIPSGSTYTIV